MLFRSGAHKDLFQQLQRLGFNRIRADGTIYSLANPPELERFYSHNIDVVIDRILRTPSNKKSKKATGNPLPSGLTQDQLAEAVRKGLLVGQGVLILSRMIPLDSPEGDMSTDWGSDPEQDIYYSQEYACSQCGTSFQIGRAHV